MSSAMIKQIVDTIKDTRDITLQQLEVLLNCNDEEYEYLRVTARSIADEIYGKEIYIRGLIEFTNICKRDCYYCGLRSGNKNLYRYRLTKEEILACCKTGYQLGFRTFVLQGGEDVFFNDEIMVDIISSIKSKYPDCALTLSLGERTRDSYQRMYDAGADRYLLRHETADLAHYQSLHPSNMSLEERMQCLKVLKEIGYQTGCGFMVGSPNQSVETLYKDLQFIRELKPQMVGIGPFISQKDTPFKDQTNGTLEMTIRLLSIIRLLQPHVLLPSTTALATISPTGREQGILAGANVVMPNLSPTNVREHYNLYDHKASFGDEASEGLKIANQQLQTIGYHFVSQRGDYKEESKYV